jgi:CRISPR-associated protein Cmr4
MACKTYWLHAITPVHAGVGMGQGFIDLPIMREKITNWPLIPGSSVKGVLADRFTDSTFHKLAFGQGGDDNANAGAVVFTDARVICLAARSYYGTFAYVTCPLALTRLQRDAKSAGLTRFDLNLVTLSEGSAVVPEATSKISHSAKVCLGELDLNCTVSALALAWARQIAQIVFPEQTWNQIFLERFVVVPDETFNFLCEIGCEVTARIQLDRDKKIVKRGHFWYEESLPAESILSGLVWSDRIYQTQDQWDSDLILEEICAGEHVLQVGGKANVGKGRMRCCFGGGNGNA